MKVLAAAALAAGLAFASSAGASTAQTGFISNIAVNSHGVVSFQHSGQRTAPPACQIQAANLWIFNITTPQGQAKLSVLLTAYAQHTPVAIIGTGACAEWGDTESIDVMFVKDHE